jgi:phosphatidylserine/phosphatidylglycerophosphate/cardiolipin synthase-like enzyme
MRRRTKLIAAVTIAFYIAGVISAIHAVMSVRTPQGAIAWSVSLVSFPFIAVPAYLVFGRSKFEGMVQAYGARQTEIDALADQIRHNIDPWVVEAERRPGAYNAVRKLTGMALTHGNDVELLIDGKATFDSLLAGIAQAHDYILFQFYMIHDDELGRRVQQALIERARAGVHVYVLYDEIGSNGLPPSYAHALREAGAEVSPFGATQGLRNRFQVNFRNHRKMVVVDGVTGWIGGHNVGDEYLGLDPEFTPWRDTHVRLEGPVVTQLQSVIAQDWYWATRRIPKLNWVPHAACERRRARDDRADRANDAARDLGVCCSSRHSTRRRADLDHGTLLRARRGRDQGAATCRATGCGRAHPHVRQGRQHGGAPCSVSLHAPAGWTRHPVLRVPAGIPAREGHADRRRHLRGRHRRTSTIARSG